MKFSKRMICLFLTVMLLGAVLALPAYAAESDCIQGIAFVNATSLRMRSAPSLSGKVLKSAAKNEVVVLLATPRCSPVFWKKSLACPPQVPIFCAPSF